MLIVVLLVIVYGSLKLEDDKINGIRDERLCVPFDSVVENGFCSKFMKNQMAKHRPNTMKIIDKNIKQSFKVVSFFLKSVSKPGFYETVISGNLKKIYDHIEGQCPKYTHEDLKKIIKSIISTKQTLLDTVKCFNEDQTQWLVCNILMRPCIRSQHDRTDVERLLPCVEEVTVQQSKLYCNYVISNFSLILYKATALCPAVFKAIDLNLLNTANISYIERCQKRSQDNENTTFTDTCYKYTGEHYNGTKNVTSSGKPCKIWRDIIYLNNYTYPTLKENFCRNPQSYGDRPWCYTNLITREWEYCTIEKCLIRDQHKRENVSFHMEYIVLTIGIAIFLIATSVVTTVMRQQYIKKGKNIRNIDVIPYSSEKIKEVLKSNMDQMDEVTTRNGQSKLMETGLSEENIEKYLEA